MAAIIDVVSWTPYSGEQLFAWKFPATNLSTYTQLIVAESQEAVLFSKGQVVGKFGPGKHTLNTENLPVLRALYGLPFGGSNPFTAEVWFVNKLIPLNLDWSTDSMMYHDPDYHAMVPLVARGRYGIRVDDAERFLIKLVGTADEFSAYDLTDNFLGATVAKTKATLLQFIMFNRIGIKSISAHLDSLSENLRQSIQQYWEGYGFSLISFYITTIEVDSETEAGRAILKAMSQQSAQIIGGYTWQQSQVFGTAEKAIDRFGEGGGQGGLLGAVIATNIMGNLSGGGLLNPAPHYPGQSGSGTSPSAPTKRSEVYCSNCAKKFGPDSKFCPHCGDPYHGCPRCGADNDEKARKCVSCGETLRAGGISCTHCKTSMAEGSAFCPSCGKPVESMEGCCKRCGFAAGRASFCPRCGFKNL